MNDKCMKEIKKEDRKAFKYFVLIIFIAIVAEHLLWVNFGYVKQHFGENLSSLLINILKEITPFATLILSTLVIIVSIIIYTNSRKGYNLWKQSNEDDDGIDKIEKNLDYLMLFISINQIVCFFFLGIGGMLLPFENINGGPSFIKLNCFFMGFILFMIATILIPKKVINFKKEINPLLKGSVYDIRFAKKWLDSCDESIKLGMFKSAYKAHRSVSVTCLILWLFCVFGYDLWHFGIMPIVIVTIIWLVQTVSYCMESIKHSNIG